MLTPFHHGKSACASNHPTLKHFGRFTSRGTRYADASSKIDGASITKIWHFGERAERQRDNRYLWISSLKFPVRMVAVLIHAGFPVSLALGSAAI